MLTFWFANLLKSLPLPLLFGVSFLLVHYVEDNASCLLRSVTRPFDDATNFHDQFNIRLEDKSDGDSTTHLDWGVRLIMRDINTLIIHLHLSQD